MMTTRDQFLAKLREIVDAWHAGDIDFATFIVWHEDTWEEIRSAGPQIAAEVLRALCDQLPTTPTDTRSGRRHLCRAQIVCPETGAQVAIDLTNADAAPRDQLANGVVADNEAI